MIPQKSATRFDAAARVLRIDKQEFQVTGSLSLMYLACFRLVALCLYSENELDSEVTSFTVQLSLRHSCSMFRSYGRFLNSYSANCRQNYFVKLWLKPDFTLSPD